MMASSVLYPYEIVIDDSTPLHVVATPPGQSRGLDLSLRDARGYAGVAEAFPASLLIDPSEYQARIAEKEELKSRLSDLSVQAGLPCKDQQQTNYCWVNAPTHCVEILRVFQNQGMVPLSPASAGGPLTGFQNVGGWGKTALEWIIAHGLVPVDRWPANAIDSRYYTDSNKQLALDYRVDEWWELEPNNMQQLYSCLLRDIPVAVGYNWWGHEVTASDAVWLDGTIALRIRNSWGMGWGDRGFSILQGNRARPDDAVAPRTALAA